MAYFSMWWLHGNQVSKTRFISLINKNKSKRNHQNIREEPREKRKKKKKKNPETERERRSRSELVALDHRTRPRQTQATRNPGLGLVCLGHPRPRANPGLGLAHLCRRGLGLPRSLRPESFSPSNLSLPLIWVFRIGIDVFGISWICFWVFQSVHETSNFLKFFWVRNRVLETRFSNRCYVEKNTTSDMINPWKSSLKNSIYRL